MKQWLGKMMLTSLILSACAGAAGEPTIPTAPPTEPPVPTVVVTATPQPTRTPRPTLPPDEQPPWNAEREFITDFRKHSVPYTEILSGGPTKDGIPAVDFPEFIIVEEADRWLSPVEPVVLIEVGADARAYPLQILTWHEIVNDTVGDVPLTVTFCPLCNTAIAFERTLDGQVLDFGTTGRLRHSNLIMYDRQTETWWQQATGEAIVGDQLGAQLTFYPAAIISWNDFKTAYPAGQVLSRETGFERPYGRNPYSGYDDVNSSPFLFRGETPGTLPAMARVLTVDLNGEAVAYPYDALEDERVINDAVGSEDIVVLWQAGTASALDTSRIVDGRDVGAAAAFSRQLDGQALTFSFDGERIVDGQTGSEWNVLGQAVSGPLAGQTLTPVVSINHFWFSWAAFRPETRIYSGPSS